jgi:Ca2+-binding EF-hand superfamily protein
LKRTTWAALAASILILSPGAQAAGEKPQRMGTEKFDALDTNHDGAISREEAAAARHLAEVFDQVDANHDGKVLPAELKAYAKTHRGKGMEKLDTNGDGVITRDEAAKSKKMASRFDAADADKDGRVTEREATALKGK